MTTISTGSRLHFGLFNAGNLEGPQFGGLGLMIDAPRVQVTVRPSNEWKSIGPECERALRAAQAISTYQAFEVFVEHCPPLHSGLGVGTQLAMAAGRAVATALGIEMTSESLARIVGRGLRSGIGVRGFESGGFIFDHGHTGNESARTERFDWPDDWSILLVRPHVPPTWHGPAELGAFARPRNPTDSACVESGLRTLAGDVVGALATRDFDSFGECLYRYNRLAGEAFVEEQGGIYSSSAVDDVVQWFRGCGIRGVGQSSWGPTVFAMVPRKNAGEWLNAIESKFAGMADVAVVDGANSGFQMRSA